MKKIVIASIFLFSIIVGVSSLNWAADSIEGSYAVKGWNPGVATSGPPSYTGRATIVKEGETYKLSWSIGSQIFGGVGFYIAESQHLAVGYADLKSGWFGIVNYKVKGNSLESKWATFTGKGRLGTEILTKQ